MKELKALYRRYLNLSLLGKILWFILCLLITIYFIGVSGKGGDFASYLEASVKMINGTNIYAPPYVHLRYSYSPFWAMVLMPLALLPSSVAVFIWLMLNVLLLGRVIVILRSYFEIRFDNYKLDLALWVLIALYMSRFIELNFHHAQMTILLLWIILEAVKMSDGEQEWGAGILIGLGTIIKIMPIVMIPYFIFRRRFKATVASIFTVIITFFLPILYLGQVKFLELNNEWFKILRPDNSDFQYDNVDYFSHNLSALLYRLFMRTDAPYVRNILSLDYGIATKCVWAIILLLIILTVYFLATPPFHKIKSKNHILYEMSYITLIMPLIFPHQMKYAFCFSLPAICCLLKVIIQKYEKGDRSTIFKTTLVLMLISFILCTMTTDLILGVHFSIVTQYLKTITIGTILLIPALMLNKKYFIAPNSQKGTLNDFTSAHHA